MALLSRPTAGVAGERGERGLHIKQHPLTQCRLCQVGGGEGPRWNARGGERQDEMKGWRRNGGRRGASQNEEPHQNAVLLEGTGNKVTFLRESRV